MGQIYGEALSFGEDNESIESNSIMSDSPQTYGETLSFGEDTSTITEEDSPTFVKEVDKVDDLETFVTPERDPFELDDEDDEEVDEDAEGRGWLKALGSDVGSFVSSGEIFTAPMEGVVRGLGQATRTVSNFGNWLENTLHLPRLVTSDEEGNFTLEVWSNASVKQAIADGKMSSMDSITGTTMWATEEIDDLVQDSETISGGLVSGISQFATGMIMTRGVGGKVGTVKSAMTRGAITDAAFFDPDMEGIAGMSVSMGGSFDNEIAQALMKNETDSEFIKRLKGASEGALVGLAFEGVFRGFKYARAVKNGRADIEINGKLSAEKGKAVDDAVEDLNSWLKAKKTQDNLEKLRKAQAIGAGKGGRKAKGLGSKPEAKSTKVDWDKLKEAKKVADEKAARKKALEEAQKRKWKYDIKRVKANTKVESEKRFQATSKVAEDNRVLRDKMIRELEAEKGIIVSKVAKDGLKEIDGQLAREESKKLTQKLADSTEAEKTRWQSEQGKLSLDKDQLTAIEAIRAASSKDGLFQAILKPESLDSIVAIAADFQKTFKISIGGGNRTVIDDLFKLTVDKNLIGDQRLLDILAKHQMTFDDYIMTIVGSGSDAGRLMNKLAQIGKNNRFKTPDELQIEAERVASQGTIRNLVMRIENIRRGALVSQVATAARNLSSGVIRMPLEGVANIMDDVLWHAGRGNYGEAVRTLKPTNWRGSFTGMKVMMANPIGAKQFTDEILKQPEFASNMDLMFNQLNEMRRHVGRGEGGNLDKVLSVMEKAVDTVNIPNRAQEFLVRRAAFLGELERLVKREWGIDLIDTIDAGKLRDLIANSSSFKPAGKNVRSFATLVDSATYKALDVTYAKQPDLPTFRHLSSFITRNGLTAIIPFPRFMFNSIELVTQYAGGASIPLTRKMIKMVGNKPQRAMSEAERRYVSRNITGLGIVGAAYMYRSDKTLAEPDSDYKLLKFGKQVLDTSPIFPMRQFMWMGEATKRLLDGTFDDWYDHREAIQTFTGSNLRTGNGNMMFDDIASIMGSEDYLAQRDIGKTVGRALGNYLSTFAVPFAQIIDAERAAGLIPKTFQDVVEEPSIENSSFIEEFVRPFNQRGYSQEALLTGAGVFDEKEYPEREFVLSDNKRRSGRQLLAKVVGGLNLSSADPEYGQFYKNLGYTDFKLGSRSKSPAVRRFENRYMREVLKGLAGSAEGLAESFGREFDNKPPEEQAKENRESYVNDKIKLMIDKEVRGARSNIAKTKNRQAPPETQVLMEYSKLNRQTRRFATTLYFDKYGEHPDFTDVEDMQQLVKIGQKVR